MEDIGYGLRPDPSARGEGGQRLAQGRQGRRQGSGRHEATSRFEQYKELVSKYTLEYTAKLSGVEPEKLRAAGQALRRPEEEDRVLLDHGLQPAHARHLGQQPHLQRASADRQDLRARQRPVLADRPAVGLRHGARGRHLLAPPAGRHGGRPIPRIAKRRRRSGSCRRGHAARQASATTRCVQHRMLKDGKLNAYWVQCTNNMQTAPNMNGRAIRATATRTTSSSSPIPIRPSPRSPPTSSCRRRCGWRRKAPTAMPSGARQFWRQQVKPPGEARSDLWQTRRVLEILQGRGGVAGGADRQEARVARQDPLRRALSPTAS